MKKLFVLPVILTLISLLVIKPQPQEGVSMANHIAKSSIVIRVKVQEKDSNKEGWFLCSGTQLEQGILTNAHCYPQEEYNIKQLWIRGYDQKSYKASVIKIDVDKDLLLLRSDAHYPTASISRFNLKQGEVVYAIGHGLGLENSFSSGIVSFINRQLGKDDKIHYIQTTMPINGGFSGSGLYNSSGKLCGVNEAVISPDILFHSWSGITLAVGLQDIRAFLKK